MPKLADRGLTDIEIWELAKARQATFITTDHGFTNTVCFRTQNVEAVIYLRRGNLSSEDEVALIRDFLATHNFDEHKECLVTL